jgi:AcrR family transcriptional regulator
MPRPKRTRGEIRDMRRRILDAALALLHEEGPGKLSVRAIAERAGISHMSLYSYFENHAELLAALRTEQRGLVLARRAETMAKAREGDIREVLRAVLERYISFARNHPSIYRFLSAEGQEADFSRYAAQGLHEEMEHLAELVRMGMEHQVFHCGDALTAALVIAGMINGPLIMYRLPGAIDQEVLRALEAEVVDAALHYLTCGAR